MSADDRGETVAVLGLGAMGLPMATRLVGEFTVRAFDPSEERRLLATASGISAWPDARTAVVGAATVVIAVRDASQLDSLLFGPDGVASSLASGTAVVLTSTVGASVARETGDRLAVLDVRVVDAPVSGGPTRAGTGDLLIVVGAAPDAIHAARAVLDRLSTTLVVIGDRAGAGQDMKTVNQLLAGVHIAAASEALALAKGLGIDPATALAALESGAAASFMLSDRGPRVIENQHGREPEVKSRIDIFVKDLGIVTDAGHAAGVETPVAAAALSLFQRGAAAGLGAHDDSSVVRLLG